MSEQILSDGEKIKELREALKYSQVEFAKKAGISRTNLYMYETQKTSVSAKMLMRIAKTFGAEEYLIGGLSLKDAMPKIMNTLRHGEESQYYYQDFSFNLYDDFAAYENNETDKKFGVSKNFFTLFSQISPMDYDVIKLNSNIGEPFIKSGQCIFMSIDEVINYSNGDLLIVRIENEYFIKRYLYNPVKREIRLIGAENDFTNLEFKEGDKKNREKIKIIGVIKYIVDFSVINAK